MKLGMKVFFGIVVVIAILALAAGIGSPFYIQSEYLGDGAYPTHKDLGPIGDWLGGSSTPFFTVASFFILVAALIAQMAELRATREEFAQQNKEFKEQNQLMSIQRFESTFFQMVSLHHQIVNSIEDVRETRGYGSALYVQSAPDSISSVVIRGRQVLADWGSERKCFFAKLQLSEQELRDDFEDFYNKKESNLGHYFRNLFHIVEFIDKSSELTVYDDKGEPDTDKTMEQRRKYIRIIRAQLSTTEMILLFYNSLTTYGTAFHDLIVKYRLLNNLRKELLPVAMRPVFIAMKQN
ncbi:putative phage abortive infection protein [Cohnella fermenti]|uniref:Phage abortive infection protein n=1 Tax=Cohnella fermenti TaxID=2565925 RepID=A0A4S4BNM5_9BACL|nr:putative phage abortive infection protein [Cohnella fermenti]THF74128.1 hypothetical protein E6C55_26225 [Cohnella fermenti]